MHHAQIIWYLSTRHDQVWRNSVVARTLTDMNQSPPALLTSPSLRVSGEPSCTLRDAPDLCDDGESPPDESPGTELVSSRLEEASPSSTGLPKDV